ncbi:MAG TPA: YidC/Oxa1 family membrane protein insertase [Candidatus Paceibacterota bacterium]|nr:YidC/Oxa1 family membrane protein insertase [Candidatus Paceibacterota bacterium]
MVELFNTVLYNPLFNILVILYDSVALQDLGLAIIFLTILIRLLLFPVFHESLRQQKIQQALQPHIKKIQDKHKDNKEAQTKAILNLYSEHKANPALPLVLILIQLPILIALFSIFRAGITVESLNSLYSFVPRPEIINHTFFGLLDLTKASLLLTGLAAVAQYFQSKLSIAKLKPGETQTDAERIGRSLVYVAPFITVVVLWSLPAAIALYWIATTIFSAVQQVIINKAFKHGESKGTA